MIWSAKAFSNTPNFGLHSAFTSGLHNSMHGFNQDSLNQQVRIEKYTNKMVWVYIPHSCMSWVGPLMVALFGKIMESLCRSKLDAIMGEPLKIIPASNSSLCHYVRSAGTHFHHHVFILPYFSQHDELKETLLSLFMLFLSDVLLWNDTPNRKML